MGYKFQFVTLAGFHALNHSMFELARKYKEEEWLLIQNYNKPNLQVRNMDILQHVISVKSEQVILMKWLKLYQEGHLQLQH